MHSSKRCCVADPGRGYRCDVAWSSCQRRRRRRRRRIMTKSGNGGVQFNACIATRRVYVWCVHVVGSRVAHGGFSEQATNNQRGRRARANVHARECVYSANWWLLSVIQTKRNEIWKFWRTERPPILTHEHANIHYREPLSEMSRLNTGKYTALAVYEQKNWRKLYANGMPRHCRRMPRHNWGWTLYTYIMALYFMWRCCGWRFNVVARTENWWSRLY